MSSTTKTLTEIKTLGELKASGYKSQTVKDELRANLIAKMKSKTPIFKSVLGYDNTVIPAVQRAILARHNINLLGLRGQAKTRIARAMVELLDDYIPVITGSEINDDPLNPISRYGKDQLASLGDNTPISWLHSSDRYIEKLATPDVTVADLIGDADPIKAANLKLDYADERVIHFGLVPRAHRGLFVINELPDLQPRIQVALLNILQEGDVQIRGFQLRLPLDVQFVFTANPEDYTNRGAIITPLKDRIQSQIITHYPTSIEISQQITEQEAALTADQSKNVEIPELVAELAERVSFEARESEYIDQKSGVSARLTITAFESLISTAERRALLNGETTTCVRISDLSGIVPAITGKVELVYEGEQEGPEFVALRLIGQTIRQKFPQVFPNPETLKRQKIDNPYTEIITFFENQEIELHNDASQEEYQQALDQIDGLEPLIEKYLPGVTGDHKYLWKEFVLHGLAEYSLISKHILDDQLSFGDLLNTLFSGDEDDLQMN